jgi:FkbM family methyltransferase
MSLPVLDETIVASADTRYGRVAHLRGDGPIGASLQHYGEWAQLEIDFLRQLVAPGETVVDAGANVGTHTLAFSRAAGSRGRVLAFEPQPVVFDLLRTNLAANAAVNVVAYPCALGADRHTRYLPALDYAGGLNAGAVALRTRGADAARAVEVMTLDGLELDAVRLVKIDVEGMEPDVLEGARATLARCRPIVFAECNDVPTGAQVMYAVRDAGYLVYFKRSAAFNPANFRAVAANRFGPACESALLCVPREIELSLRRVLAPCPDLRAIRTASELALQLERTPRYGDAPDTERRDPELEALRAQLAERDEEIERLRYRLAKQAYQRGARERLAEPV